ncbi:ribokinase [Rathayibacter sp. AY2B7]|uniref:ribokinase n=1 Tax=Rathayibacter sp. AY2B7 TaxID=2080571 RepID=UPI000CE8FD7A|nr:ribokinase [Rathayibacter sp. AY2B7]PPG64121.1 ribokinase [Rathayibacter sp. AY2B7]
MKHVAVIGSANVDLVVEVPRRPGAGETLLGSDLQRFAGGKGANQAAAAARAGARTTFHACVGSDSDGEILRSRLAEAGVDVEGIRDVDRPTGTALVLVTPDGENSIVVSPGANDALDLAFIDASVNDWSPADLLVLNLESPIWSVEHAARLAEDRGVRVLLNAAPAASVHRRTLVLCDPLVVNEHEARILLEDEVSSFSDLALRFLEIGVRSVVITLGAAGAVFGENHHVQEVSAHAVDVIDTTGAGDAFVGSLACELAGGSSLQEAVRFASAVAAVSVQHLGAQSSYPDRESVERWLARG